MIEIKGYQIKNTLVEMTIAEYEKITSILNNEELLNIERYMECLVQLGLPESALDEMSDEEFFEAISSFNLKDGEKKLSLVKSIIIDGSYYDAYTGDQFVLKVKDLSLIEKAVTNTPDAFLAQAMAIIFRKRGKLPIHHYDPANLKEATELFANQSAALAFPYLIYITEKLKNKLQSVIAASQLE